MVKRAHGETSNISNHPILQSYPMLIGRGRTSPGESDCQMINILDLNIVRPQSPSEKEEILPSVPAGNPASLYASFTMPLDDVRPLDLQELAGPEKAVVEYVEYLSIGFEILTSFSTLYLSTDSSATAKRLGRADSVPLGSRLFSQKTYLMRAY